MRSLVVKRAVNLEGGRTTTSLELEFWTALEDIARVRGWADYHDVVRDVDATSDPRVYLATAIRLYVLAYYRAAK